LRIDRFILEMSPKRSNEILLPRSLPRRKFFSENFAFSLRTRRQDAVARIASCGTLGCTREPARSASRRCGTQLAFLFASSSSFDSPFTRGGRARTYDRAGSRRMAYTTRVFVYTYSKYPDVLESSASLGKGRK